MADTIAAIGRHFDLLRDITVVEFFAALERKSARSKGIGLFVGGGGGLKIVVHPFDACFHNADKVAAAARLCGMRARIYAIACNLLLATSVSSALVASGCAAKPAHQTSVATVPADLSIEVTVARGDGLAPAQTLQTRTLDIILLADGSLHAATGEAAVAVGRPGRVRQLTRDQVAELWALLGRLDLHNAGEAPDGFVAPPAHAELLRVLSIQANGKRHRTIERLTDATPDPAATTQLIRWLGALAWLRDEPIVQRPQAPLRYDFGPDPWARYRPQSDSE